MNNSTRGAINKARTEVESAALLVADWDTDDSLKAGELRSLRSIQLRLNDIANRLAVLGDGRR